MLPPEPVQKALKSLLDHFEMEDKAPRERQLRICRKLKFYWAGFHRIWYDSVARDWRVWDEQSNQDEEGYYDKPINVFRAYLESIIAALSVTVPKAVCFPEDANNPMDLTTAKAGDKIGNLILKHNEAELLWIHALYIYCTEGMIAAYNYSKEDESYGTYKESIYEEYEAEVGVCPNCNYEGMKGDNCPECDIPLESELRPARRLKEELTKPKARQCIEVYGQLYVKIPLYAMKQADMPYLIWSYETHYSNIYQRYPHLKDKKNLMEGPSTDLYEAYARSSPQYYGEQPLHTVTCRNAWFRPSSYYTLGDEERKLLEHHYPSGVKAVFANDCFAEAVEEKLDDCWTITHNPLSDYLSFDPLGMLLTSIQDITNDLTSLTLQTIEHGVPETFADPSVLDFEAYRNREVLVGGVTPAKSIPGRNLAEGFHTLKTASLGTEVLPFSERIQGLGQLASGALPSLFGGSSKAGSETAAEYSMSRAQALQRLQTPWKMLTKWWKEILSKTIPDYIEDLSYDEQYVEKNNNGGFINVFIRKTELEGSIGNIELDVDEQLPVSWSQQKDVIMELLQVANPAIMQAMLAPENIPYIKRAIGLIDFTVPGEDDRNKQYEEIYNLTNSAPIVLPPSEEMIIAATVSGQQAQPQEFPSVEVEPDVDDHLIHATICREWLVSDAGRLCKIENPEGYRNVLLHLKQHMMLIAPPMEPEISDQSKGQKETVPEAGKENDSFGPIQ